MSKDGGPAFPLWAPPIHSGEGAIIHQGALILGMSLRDYFAAAALHGIAIGGNDIEQAAVLAYQVADAMLKERAK